MTWSKNNITTLILDRDGVINRETGNFVKTLDEWQVIEGSLEAIARLTKSGRRVFVATNQSGIARGLYTESMLQRIHRLMLDQVKKNGGEIAGVYYCPHVDSDNCDCRKPKPGLLKQISKDHGIELSKSIMVGDSIRDIKAGIGAGAHAALVCKDESLKHLLHSEGAGELANIPVYGSLAEFVDNFLA